MAPGAMPRSQIRYGGGREGWDAFAHTGDDMGREPPIRCRRPDIGDGVIAGRAMY